MLVSGLEPEKGGAGDPFADTERRVGERQEQVGRWEPDGRTFLRGQGQDLSEKV